MHEILAPILWVVERDAIELGESSKTLGEDALIKAIFDAEYIEHDAFALFGQVMQSAKNFYEQTTTYGRENPMVARSRRIFNEMLPLVDSRLAAHLENIDIVPQIFLMRWIRLLFGREFAFDEMLTVWDVIFAEDATLEIVDHISLAMLLRIHWDLINADYNAALTLLLKYPEPGRSMPAQTFALDALYLRNHMDQHCGSHLISKYTGRPLQNEGRPLTPPALQRNITTFSGSNTTRATSSRTSLSPPRSSFQPRNFEAVLQSTAKNIYARSEKLGISKAVRSAVDEVHRKAQEIRDLQTPTPPVVRRPRGSRSGLGAEPSQRRIKTLQDRSKQLSKLLQGAVSELWEFQKVVTENADGAQDGIDAENVEKLSAAIAKVQFIQVFLDDPDLPLPSSEVVAAEPDEKSVSYKDPTVQTERLRAPSQDESAEERGADKQLKDTTSALTQADHMGRPVDELADPSSFEDIEQPLSNSDPHEPMPRSQSRESPAIANLSSTEPYQSQDTSSSRPRLEQSSFSWMLDKESGASEPLGNRPSSSQSNSWNRTFLFGDTPGDSASGSKDRSLSRSSGKKSTNLTREDRDEVFDLGSLRHGISKHA
jgi:TBC1 domain family protein 5